jgi:hypothetical protein
MNKKHFVLFAVVTVIVVIAAIFAVNKQQSAVTNKQAGQYLFSGLETKVNDVTQVVIQSAEETTTVSLTDDGWQVVEKGNYPANISKVKEMILKIAAMTTVEAKTKKAENYATLNVEDPSVEDANSVLVTLRDASGNDLASVIVGRQITGSFTTVGQDQMYVRKNQDDQVWLVKGALIVDDTPDDWLVEDLMDISVDRIQEISIQHPEDPDVIIRKSEPGDGDFELQNVPDGKVAKSQADLKRMAQVLESLRLEDVTRTDEMTFSGEKTITTKIQTFDGLVVTAVGEKKNTDYWVKLSAQFDPSARYTAPPEAAESQESSAAPADPHAGMNPPKPLLKDADAVRQEAEQLQKMLEGWVFAVSRTDGKALSESLEDLIKNKT